MTSPNSKADSDSVNPGSNPGSPATLNADVCGVSCAPPDSEKSEISEQTAHTGRTKVGTVLGLRLGSLAAAAAVLGSTGYVTPHRFAPAGPDLDAEPSPDKRYRKRRRKLERAARKQERLHRK